MDVLDGAREMWFPYRALPSLLLSLLATEALARPGIHAPAKTHTLAQDQTLSHVAVHYGCTIAELTQANRDRVGDVRKLRPGLVLIIPECKGPARGGALPRGVTDCRWRQRDIDSKRLRRAMRARGFRPPKKFRALVIETTLGRNNRILRHRLFDYGRLSTNHQGWNPASTVKLFSAVAALETVRRHGFGPDAHVTFHYRRGPKALELRALFEQSMHLSRNIAHNRMAQLAGFDELNGERGTLKRAGLDHSYVMRAYDLSRWTAEGNSASLRASPAITLRQGRRVKRLARRRSTTRYPCFGSACTSVSDLARMMCVMMLHEQLPAHRRLRLGGDNQSPHLALLRRAMNRLRSVRRDPAIAILKRHFKAEEGYVVFQKGGFARDWTSENLFIYNARSRRRWQISMVGYPGRSSLNRAMEVLARIIRDPKDLLGERQRRK